MLSSIFSTFFSTLLSQFPSQAKLVLTVVVALLIFALAGTTYYYKDAYENQLTKAGEINAKYSQSLTSLAKCSNEVADLAEKTKTKLEESKEAFDKALGEAKKYQYNSNKILTLKPVGKNDCEASYNLLKQYVSEINK